MSNLQVFDKINFLGNAQIQQYWANNSIHELNEVIKLLQKDDTYWDNYLKNVVLNIIINNGDWVQYEGKIVTRAYAYGKQLMNGTKPTSPIEKIFKAIFGPGKPIKRRMANCYRCRSLISTERFGNCRECGWILCSCGACGCTYLKERHSRF